MRVDGRSGPDEHEQAACGEQKKVLGSAHAETPPFFVLQRRRSRSNVKSPSARRKDFVRRGVSPKDG
jgi:hypothetical protein